MGRRLASWTRFARIYFSFQIVGAIVAVIVLCAGVLSPGVAGVSIEAQRTLAIFAAAIVLWLAKPVPYAVSSILVVSLLFALGTVESFSAATTGFSSTLVFFLVLLLLLGDAISSVNLDEQLATRLFSADVTPHRTLRSIAGGLLGLALLMPSAMARAITFIPIVNRLASDFGFNGESGFERGAFLLLGHVNPIASMALMTGGGMALVTSEIINTTVQPITWVEWAVLMLPPTLLLYGFATACVSLVASADETVPVDDGGTASADTGQDVEPLNRDQRLVGWVMAGAIGGWIVGSFVGVPTVLPAVLAVTVLSLPGARIITPADVREISWGVIFVIGAMLSILSAMESTGAITFIVEVLTEYVPFAALSHWQTIAVLLGVAVGIRILFSTGSAAIVVALPIVLEFGGAFGVNQLYLALATLLVVGSTTIFPFNTTAVLVSMEEGPLTHQNVAIFGMITMGCSVLVVAFAWLVYWPMVT